MELVKRLLERDITRVELGVSVKGEISTYYAFVRGFQRSGLSLLDVPNRESVVGFLRVIPYTNKKDAIDKIWVHPEYRRSGIATSLIRFASPNHKPFATPILTSDGEKFFKALGRD